MQAVLEAVAAAASATTLVELGERAFPALARALHACPGFMAEAEADFSRTSAFAGDYRQDFVEYLRDFVPTDPVAQAALSTTAAVVVPDRYVEPRTIRASRAYADFHAPRDLEHHLSIRFHGERIIEPGALVMGLGRGRRGREFGARDVRLAAMALPAFRGAARRIARSARAARQGISPALLGLDAKGRLLFVSSSAESLLGPALGKACQLPPLLVEAAQRVTSLRSSLTAVGPLFSLTLRLPDGTIIEADLGTGRGAGGETIALVQLIDRDACKLRTRAAQSGLTQAETDVVAALALGLSNAQIGKRLFISIETVKTHLYRAFRKLGVSSRTQALLALNGQ